MINACTPGMDRLLFLSDERFISRKLQQDLKTIIQNDYPQIKLEMLTAGDLDIVQLIDTLEKADSRTGILYFSWLLKNGQKGNQYISAEVNNLVSTYTSIPIFNLNDVEIIRNGMMGGYFYTANDIKETIVQSFQQAIDGKLKNEIVMPRGPYPVMNYPLMQKKGIGDEYLPANTLFYQ